MTFFEFIYLGLEPVEVPLYYVVRQRLREIATAYPRPFDLLDVGGRKSHYTIGLPVRVTITDVLRQTEVQHRRNLGTNQQIIDQTLRRRSNVRAYLIDDMTRSELPDQHFDCVTAIEVLEHVKEDDRFVENVYRVLKPGGVFLATTPNADHPGRQIPVSEGDERFYTKKHLHRLLSSYFETVEIDYGVPVGPLHTRSLRPWSVRHPLRTILSMAAARMNQMKSMNPAVKTRAVGTRELIALARKHS